MDEKLKKEAEQKEKEEAHKEEVDYLIELSKNEGLLKALKEAKKISKLKKSAIIIDLFHDRLKKEANE